MATRSAILNVMIGAADKAARGLKRDFGEVENLQVSQKGPADFVTAADKKAESILKRELSKARPEFGLLMEESGETPGNDPFGRRFIVDPLDGTTNFMHGIPHFAISIALEQKGEILAGVIYDPIKDELFTAERGGGAFLNDRRLRVSARKRLEESLVATGIPFLGHGDPAPFLRELNTMMNATSGVRRMGSAALDLAYVAAGRYDAYWERDLSPWDIAAGILLVKEAGGYVREIEGKAITPNSPSILAVNDPLDQPITKMLKNANPKTRSTTGG